MNTTTSLRPQTKAKPIKRSRFLAILLLCGDIAGLSVCWQLAHWLRFRSFLDVSDPVSYLVAVLVLAALYLAEAYRPDTQVIGLRAPMRIVLGGALVTGAIASLMYVSGYWSSSPLLKRGIWLPGLLIFLSWAVLLRVWAVTWLRSQIERRNWLLLGLDQAAIRFAQESIERDSLSRFVVLTDDPKTSVQLVRSGLSCVGQLHHLPDWSTREWSGVLISSTLDLSDDQVRQLMDLRLKGIPVYRLPDFYESLWYKLPADLLHDNWFVFSTGFNLLPNGLNTRFKRLFDLVITSVLLLVLSPLMLLVAIAIRLESPGSVFYSQVRTGLNGKTFRVHKFRSMRQDAEKLGAQWAQERDPRITRVGYWLRLSRIDELPQLWNVLKGEMSLIGPRPERPEFDAKLNEAIPYYNMRYLVKPGITGWAQVLYPYGASVEDAYEKLAYDLYYIKNYSLLLDIAIVFKTIRVVLLGKGR